MKNKLFMQKLAQKLLLRCSYCEMKDILDDYKGFMDHSEQNMKERPEEIIKALEQPQTVLAKNCAFIILLIVCGISLLVYTDQNFYLPLILQYIIPFAFLTAFPVLYILSVNKKKLKMLTECHTKPHRNKARVYWSAVLWTGTTGFLCLIMINLSSMSLQMANTIHWIQNLVILAAVIGIATGCLFILRHGYQYDFLLYNFSGILAVMLQLRAIQSTMLGIDRFGYMVLVILVCYWLSFATGIITSKAMREK